MLLCWVVHRSVRERDDCVTSSYIGSISIDGQIFSNCRFESRLNLNSFFTPIDSGAVAEMRALEGLEPLTTLWPTSRHWLNIELRSDPAKLFDIQPGRLRLGAGWLNEPMQVRRALVMAWLKTEHPEQVAEAFDLEVMTDFLILTVFREDLWRNKALQQTFSERANSKFSTLATTFASYCRSPFRSLSHAVVCDSNLPESKEAFETSWGLRPLLAAALAEIFDKLPLTQKLTVLNAIKSGARLPRLRSIDGAHGEELVQWMKRSVHEDLSAWRIDTDAADASLAIKRTFKELEIEAPTHWELTVDLTSTPAWREILEQLKRRSEFRPLERALIFTPEGAVALPGGLPVAWSADDISSQKHVMIACEWPKASETINIHARHTYAEQSCAKLSRAFWD
jgi:hypothetical protein